MFTKDNWTWSKSDLRFYNQRLGRDFRFVSNMVSTISNIQSVKNGGTSHECIQIDMPALQSIAQMAHEWKLSEQMFKTSGFYGFIEQRV